MPDSTSRRNAKNRRSAASTLDGRLDDNNSPSPTSPEYRHPEYTPKVLYSRSVRADHPVLASDLEDHCRSGDVPTRQPSMATSCIPSIVHPDFTNRVGS